MSCRARKGRGGLKLVMYLQSGLGAWSRPTLGHMIGFRSKTGLL